MSRVQLDDALRDRDSVLRTFLTPDGRLAQIPTKVRKRLVVLDYLAQQFPIGEVFAETEVNNRLRTFHDDVAALRRYLVEEEFLERRDGMYWRCGGTVTARVAHEPGRLMVRGSSVSRHVRAPKQPAPVCRPCVFDRSRRLGRCSGSSGRRPGLWRSLLLGCPGLVSPRGVAWG